MIPVEDGNTRCGLTWSCLATPMHTLLAAFSPCFPGGAVGIAGIYDQRPHQPLSTAKMLASNRHRRRDDLIAREYGGRGSAIGN